MIDHHSPSSASTAALCPRKWYYGYVLRQRAPEVTWSEIEAAGPAWAQRYSKGQRSAALGKAVHAVLEAYFLGATPDWESTPGRIALTARAHLPARESLAWVTVESPVDRPPWIGYVDLRFRIKDAAERARLGLPDAPVTVDFKTSSDPAQWALTPEALVWNEQGILYGLDHCDAFDRDEAPLRWVYMSTAQPFGRTPAKPVDAVIRRTDARLRLAALTDGMASLDPTEQGCPPNPSACQAYGGCSYHHSRGGPCYPPAVALFAERSPMSENPFLAQLRKKAAESATLKGQTVVAPAQPVAPSTTVAAEPGPAPSATVVQAESETAPVGPTAIPPSVPIPGRIEHATIGPVNVQVNDAPPGEGKRGRKPSSATAASKGLGESTRALIAAYAAEYGVSNESAAAMLRDVAGHLAYAATA